MDSMDGASSKPPVQDIAPKPSEQEPDKPVSGAHKFRKVKKVASSEPTSGLKGSKRKRRPESRAFEQLRAKIKPATTATQIKASELNALAVSESRVFSKKELFAAAGAEFGQGKTLRALGKMLDKYNAEVVSPNCKLTPAEKTIKTLKLREEARDFLARKEHELTRPFKLHAQSKQRIMATHQLLGQIEVLFHQQAGSDKAAYSQDCCELLCDDIENNRSELLISLYQQPGVLEDMIGEMEYSDVLHFGEAQARARVEISEPDHIRALSKGVRKVLQRMSSDDIKHHVDTFNEERGGIPQKISVTGNRAYDRGREYCTTMNILLATNETVTELGVALHQSYVDGHLMLNMVDELTEEKTNTMVRGFDTQPQVDEAAAGISKKAMKEMHVTQQLPELKPDVKKRPDVLWLSKICQFDAMLKGDTTGKDDGFRNFVRCWDEIRFKAIPAYNQRHNKDGLVHTDGSLSKELAKISPAFLEELDSAKGNEEQVRVLLKKTGLYKAPDKLEFKAAMKMADQSDNPLRKARLRHIACQDCLYRYFEQRAGVEIPLIPPKPESLRSRKPQS